MKELEKKATIVIIALTVIIAMILGVCLKHSKDVQVEKALASRTAIPTTEIDSAVKMLKNLEVPNYCIVKSEILINKASENHRVYKSEEIDLDKDISLQIATMALNPLEGELLNEDTFNIVNIEAKWYYGRTLITLSGDLNGWKTINWSSENYNLKSSLDNRKKFTIEMAENYKFGSTSTLIDPSPSEQI